jgi:hypothetical protein
VNKQKNHSEISTQKAPYLNAWTNGEEDKDNGGVHVWNNIW